MKHQLFNRPLLTTRTPSAFLLEQIRQDSNHELEWLWAAQQVTVPEERRYCLERALYISPHNRETQRTLTTLLAGRATHVQTNAINTRRIFQLSRR